MIKNTKTKYLKDVSIYRDVLYLISNVIHDFKINYVSKLYFQTV